jgi:predicted CXXCH cytochrome family protein
VFPHVSNVVGDCMSCHQPHGSSNPNALTRSQVYQLCLECHSPIEGGTLGSQPPSFHDLLSPRYRNCTTCHVAIHGSNMSPQLLK